MGPLWVMNIVVSLLIAFALLYVFKTYMLTRRIVRSRFVNSLLALTGIFLVQNVYAAYIFYSMAWDYSADLAYPLLILNLLGLAGFSIFVYLVRQ
ncbi:MAG: hypothetical protein NXY59_09175 [Aigarchaeota archaeon]|nr:hypothetical protein [Candidatus Pelearchaeum maunauluense]